NDRELIPIKFAPVRGIAVRRDQKASYIAGQKDALEAFGRTIRGPTNFIEAITEIFGGPGPSPPITNAFTVFAQVLRLVPMVDPGNGALDLDWAGLLAVNDKGRQDRVRPVAHLFGNSLDFTASHWRN